MAGEQVRNELHNDLTRVIGATSAGALMEMHPPFPWHEIATKEFVRNECEMVRVEVGGKIDKLGGRIDGVEGRIDGVEGRIGALQGQIGGLEGQIGALQGQIGGIEGQIGGLQGQIGGLEGQIGGLQGQIGGLAGRMDGLQGQINELTAEVRAGNREFFARLITAYFLMSIALAGLILAAVSLTR